MIEWIFYLFIFFIYFIHTRNRNGFSIWNSWNVKTAVIFGAWLHVLLSSKVVGRIRDNIKIAWTLHSAPVDFMSRTFWDFCGHRCLDRWKSDVRLQIYFDSYITFCISMNSQSQKCIQKKKLVRSQYILYILYSIYCTTGYG